MDAADPSKYDVARIVRFTRVEPFQSEFDLYAPVTVNGDDTAPLFAFLKRTLPKKKAKNPM